MLNVEDPIAMLDLDPPDDDEPEPAKKERSIRKMDPELRVMQDCWDALSTLDTEDAFRALDWLVRRMGGVMTRAG